MSKRGVGEADGGPELWWPTKDWQTKAEYEAHIADCNRLARSLRRLCDRYGFELVVGVLASGCEFSKCEFWKSEREFWKAERKAQRAEREACA